MLKPLYRTAVIHLARPYIRRELPGWGLLYRNLVGDYRRDHLWRNDRRERWVRGKLHGYEMPVRISGWSNRATFFLARFYDLPTQLLIRRVLKEGDTFVDVGTNEGMMSLVASRAVGPTGKVISFEPNPGPRGIFERSIARNRIANIEVHGAGLSDEPGELRLFVPSINSGEGSFTPPEDDTAGEYVTCPVLVGDEVIDNPMLIKIDVEGYEAHVLRGLFKTLEKHKPIICMEVIARHLARDGETPESLYGLLRSFGYQGHRLSLKSRREMQLLPMSHDDGDYVFAHPANPL